MRESFIDYVVARVGPSVLGGSLVACLVEGRLETIHVVLIVLGLALIVAGWYRQRAPAAA